MDEAAWREEISEIKSAALEAKLLARIFVLLCPVVLGGLGMLFVRFWDLTTTTAVVVANQTRIEEQLDSVALLVTSTRMDVGAMHSDIESLKIMLREHAARHQH